MGRKKFMRSTKYRGLSEVRSLSRAEEKEPNPKHPTAGGNEYDPGHRP
jgi:hypothetical protein